MDVVDSSGWIEYFAGEENASFFETPINDTGNLLVPVICLYEIFKRVLRELGEERALDAVGLMSFGKIVELDRQLAINAAQISHELKLAMADSMILATARAYQATLWTQDEHFKDVAGVKYIEKKPRQ
ncbi:MAG TPA: type II toxin-antitoxin system VapC family toxin [Anaerolineales bacterium]|nr:type II toxin-antitoxin system VapC family toxin [Anaerolineales bacterium]